MQIAMPSREANVVATSRLLVVIHHIYSAAQAAWAALKLMSPCHAAELTSVIAFNKAISACQKQQKWQEPRPANIFLACFKDLLGSTGFQIARYNKTLEASNSWGVLVKRRERTEPSSTVLSECRDISKSGSVMWAQVIPPHKINIRKFTDSIDLYCIS